MCYVFQPTATRCVPQTIPALLPPILNCIRMVWNLSRFYNTPERLTVLLRKLSNEIINRCCSVISLADVFSGDVDSVMVALRQSMEAGERAPVACGRCMTTPSAAATQAYP